MRSIRTRLLALTLGATVALLTIAAFVSAGGGSRTGGPRAESLEKPAGVLQGGWGGDLRPRVDIDDETEVGVRVASLNPSLDQISEMLAAIRSSSREVLDTASEVD